MIKFLRVSLNTSNFIYHENCVNLFTTLWKTCGKHCPASTESSKIFPDTGTACNVGLFSYFLMYRVGAQPINPETLLVPCEHFKEGQGSHTFLPANFLNFFIKFYPTTMTLFKYFKIGVPRAPSRSPGRPGTPCTKAMSLLQQLWVWFLSMALCCMSSPFSLPLSLWDYPINQCQKKKKLKWAFTVIKQYIIEHTFQAFAYKQTANAC